MVLEIGRVCVKVAGRDAGQMAVIVNIVDKKIVVIDGQVRRRKCNIAHLEPTSKSVKIDKDASHNAVVSALKSIDIEVVERKPRKTTKQPRKIRKGKKVVPKQAVAQKPATPVPKSAPKAAPAKETAKAPAKKVETTAPVKKQPASPAPKQ